MPTQPLPDRPSLEHLRNRARDLQRAAAAGEQEALALFAEHHPDGPSTTTLTAAQHVVARHHGFGSWPKLKEHVELRERLTRTPNDAEAGVLGLACLTYGAVDGPSRWEQARQLLAGDSSLAAASIHVAAAVADVGAVHTHLAARFGANDEGGPFRWPPLLYLTYARHDPAVSEQQVLATARALLDAGADPNAGYLWHGFPSPFTALTGVFGEGEQGPDRQPRHPHSLALARVLLDAGADPNDAQTLYNRMFRPDNDHLELLLEYGLGQGDGGVWFARLGEILGTPARLLRGQLHWAVTHGMTARVELLATHGVDISSPFTDLPQGYWNDTRTPTQLAELNARADVVACLLEHGASSAPLAASDAMVAALLAADRARVEEIGARVLAELRDQRPGLLVWAAASGLHDAVRLMLSLGFDVNAKGRGDVPLEEPWQTALHVSASRGDEDLARVLLAAGADPDIRDASFDAPALGWARHEGHPALIALLEPLTSPAAT